MQITKSRLKQIIKEEIISMAEASIAYEPGRSPEERYKGYEPPEEVTLPPRQKPQLDPDRLMPAQDPVMKKKAPGPQLADQLDHVESMLTQMDQYWKSNYGQMGPEALEEFDAARERWEMKKAQIEKMMREEAFKSLGRPGA